MNRSITYLVRARKLMAECVSDREVDLSDHVGYMCLAFGSRQIEHGISLESLFPARDCILIARSMIEGDSMLFWAVASEDRAKRWREFMRIEDWRLLTIKKAAGIAVADETAAAINREAHRVSPTFLTERAEKARDLGKTMPTDPYVRRWHDGAGYSFRAECKAHDVEGLYTSVYNKMFDWHHWGSLSIGQTLAAGDGVVAYSPSDGADAEWAVKAGIMAVLHTAAILDAHFRLGKKDEIRALVRDYYKDNDAEAGG